ncbi:hypothetical protein JYT83_01250, partial [bacterium AH-315-F18]|nr:hypothetical protein [bacterium AH-315-F18]
DRTLGLAAPRLDGALVLSYLPELAGVLAPGDALVAKLEAGLPPLMQLRTAHRPTIVQFGDLRVTLVRASAPSTASPVLDVRAHLSLAATLKMKQGQVVAKLAAHGPMSLEVLEDSGLQLREERLQMMLQFLMPHVVYRAATVLSQMELPAVGGLVLTDVNIRELGAQGEAIIIEADLR